jgi:cyanophycinase-like exopeptidase
LLYDLRRHWLILTQSDRPFKSLGFNIGTTYNGMLMAHIQQLVIIGGAEERSGDCQILREFIRRAGGRAAQIVVLTAATIEPEEAGKTYISVFKRLGAADVQIVDTRDRQDAEKLDGLLAIAQASGIFFTGGDQTRIPRLQPENAYWRLLPPSLPKQIF